MIPKIPKRKCKKSSSFSNAIAYVADDNKQEDGDNAVSNVLSLKTAAAEMTAVSTKNTRVHDPLFHFILSWPSNETPTNKDVYGSAKYALTKLGFDTSERGGHQAVFSIHRDTDNLHVHVIANRVHPTKITAVDLWQSKDKLHKICRELELNYGWNPSKGLWEIQDGQIIKADRSRMKNGNNAEDDIRSQIGQTFGDYVRDAGKSIHLIKADSWAEFHKALSQFNLQIKKRGGGYVITDKNDSNRYHAKGSAMGNQYKAASLNNKLGAYSASKALSSSFIISYKDYRLNEVVGLKEMSSLSNRSRDPALIKKRKHGRDLLYQTYKDEKNNFWKHYKESSSNLWGTQETKEKERWSEHLVKWRTQRKIIMSNTPSGEKRLVSSLIALDKARDKAELDRLRKEERGGLRKKLKNYATFPLWRTWIRARAEDGDTVAISIYRGLRYRSKEVENEITGDKLVDSKNTDYFSSIESVYAIELNDGVSFWLEHQNFATDYGYKITVHDMDNLSLENSLRIAAEKWRGKIKVSGSSDFVEKVNIVADSMDLKVKNSIRLYSIEDEEKADKYVSLEKHRM